MKNHSSKMPSYMIQVAIILADEPTGALDTKTSAEITGVFKKLNDEKTVVIVTHDPNIANQCGRIVEISDGKIVNYLL